MSKHVPEWREGCAIHYHDTYAAKQRGCKCPKAAEESRLYFKRLKGGRLKPSQIPVRGAARRLQALCALGWTQEYLSERLGTSQRHLSGITNQVGKYVNVGTHKRIVDVYEELSGTPGPSSSGRVRAQKRGWVPPLAWDDIDNDPAPAVAEVDGVLVDLVEVERVISGQQPAQMLSGESRKVALSRLVALGLTDGEIGRRVGMSRDAVSQARRRYGIRSQVPSGRRDLEVAA